MGKQSHDPGVRKRKQATERRNQELGAETPESLARNLVKTGRATAAILTQPSTPIRKPNQNGA